MQGVSSFHHAHGSGVSRRVVLAAVGGLVFLGGGCEAPDAEPRGSAKARGAGATPAGPASPSNGSARPAVTGTPTAGRAPAVHPPAARPPARPAGMHAADGTVKRWVERDGRQIALTIDDGPAPYWTERVLDVLDRNGVAATFCVVGRNVAAEPALARLVAERGHQLANHTRDHADVTRVTGSRLAHEIDRTQEAIHQATGVSARFFRAPYGAWSSAVTTACERRGLRPLGWSVDPRDWSRPSVPVLVSRLLRDTVPGSIVIEHDGGGDRSQTVAALAEVLPRLLDEGYRFVMP